MRKEDKIFTVIVCSFNGERTLEKCIKSILDQQMKYIDKVILVNNNSKDLTQSIMNQFVRDYNYIEHYEEKKQGLSFARAKGVVNTNSEWIIFIDDDNVLTSDWIANAYNYIKNNSNVGVINGVVIPYFDFDLTDKQKDVLKTIYRGLACTHLTVNDVKKTSDKNIKYVPIGAGMIIKTKPLKELYKIGWLKNTGRNGESLSSGEDSEMAEYVLKKGYIYRMNFNQILYHDIPSNRLENEYALRLYEGLANYVAYKLCNSTITRKIIVFIKSLFVLIYSTTVLKISKKNNLKYLIMRNTRLKLIITCKEMLFKK